VLRRLEAKALVERQVDPADTRAKKLIVTDRGAEVAQQAIAAVEAVDAAFFKTVSDRDALVVMLRQLAARNDT
jgi:DNA-binding MarR family transcriptional regulator